MITKAVPNLTYTSTNVIPLQFINSFLTLAGVALIILGIAGILYLIWKLGKKEIV